MFVFDGLMTRVALPETPPDVPDYMNLLSNVDWSQFNFSEIPVWNQYINPETGVIDEPDPFLRFRDDYWRWFDPYYRALVRTQGEDVAKHWRSWTCGEVWTIWRRHIQYGDSRSLTGVFTEVAQLINGGNPNLPIPELDGRLVNGLLMANVFDRYYDTQFYVPDDDTTPGHDLVPDEPDEETLPVYERLLQRVCDRYNIAPLTESEISQGLTLEGKVQRDIAANTAWATLKKLYVDFMTADKTKLSDVLVQTIMTLKERGEDWIYEVFADEFATEPDFSYWTETIIPEVERQEEEIEAIEALTAAEESARLGAAYKILGRALTSEEETYVKNFEEMSDTDIALFPELARVYWFFGGLSTYGDALIEAEDYRSYMQFVNSPAVPNELKEHFDDFDVLYDDYKRFSLMAFARAQASENYVAGGELDDPGDVVPYNTWTFGEWVSFRAAIVAIRHNIMLGRVSDVEWSTLQRLLEEQGISGFGAAFLVQSPGESWNEYMTRIGEQFGDEVVDMLSVIGATVPSPSEIIEDVAPEIRIAVRQAFIGYVEPENRMQFMDELQANLPVLWAQFSQIAGPLQPSSEAHIAAAEIRDYQQNFIKWLKDQDFRGGVAYGGMYAGFASLMKQQEQQTSRQRFMPARKQMPKEFGLGM